MQTVEAYAWLRFIAGIGLAGELGAGITLVSEIMPKETRGYGTTIVAATGILGAVVAALVGDNFDWRIAYIVGGVMGFALLALRIGVYESGMFESVKQIGSSRGNVLQLFNTWERAQEVRGRDPDRRAHLVRHRHPDHVLAGDRAGARHGRSADGGQRRDVRLPRAGRRRLRRAASSASSWAAGDEWCCCSGADGGLRRRVLLPGAVHAHRVLRLCVALGFGVGYWAVFVTVASEQFGTNIRATATTTVPNFVRGSVVLLTSSVAWLRPQVGVVNSAMIVGVVALSIGVVALWGIEETFGKDLDYVEE